MKMLAYIMNNWQAITVAILAVDAVLIPIFPNAGVLKTIRDALSPKAPGA
jgi:hypothetical protein